MKSCHFELRPYQKEALDSIPESGAFLICLATGLGKSLTFSRIPRRGRMLILSHRDELVHQPEKYFDCTFGIEQAGETSHGEEVISASVQSLVRRLEKFKPDDFDVLVTDECHHATSPSYRKIYGYFKPRLHVGFTATPNRNDGVGLKAIYEDIVFERDLKWGIENGYLSNIRCLRVDLGVDLQKVAMRLGDFASESLSKFLNIERANSAIAEAYRLYAKPPCLIFCASVAHAEALASKISGAVSVKGGEDRSEIVHEFSEGRIPCITNCMVFTEGTDLPNVQTVIMARPTKNISLYLQCVGRGTRLYPGKEYLTLIDCVGAGDKVDMCTAASLLGLDINDVPPDRRREITGNLFDLPGIINSLEDCPEVWIKNVQYVDLWAKRNDYDTHGVNYFRLPDGSLLLSEPRILLPAEDSLGRTYFNGRDEPTQRVLDYIYHDLENNHGDKRILWDAELAQAKWGSAYATDKQKALIARKLPEYDTKELTKFEAAQILTRLFAESPRNEPATRKQIYFIRQYMPSIDVSELTKSEASKLINQIKKGA